MKKYVLLGFIIVIAFSCSKEKYLPLSKEGTKLIETVVLQPEGRDFFYPVKENTGFSTHLLSGKYKEEYTARILLQFETFPDSAIIDSAQIILYPQAMLGDSSSSFEANMYKIESLWEEYEVINWGEPDLSLDSTVVLSSAMITPFYSDSDSVVFNLDAELVNHWMDTTQVEANHGVWISCEGASFIMDFYSAETSIESLRPKLEMAYHTKNHQDTTFHSIIYPSKDAFILISELKLSDEFLYIGKGVAFHDFLKFDVENEIDSTATINKADLQLMINRENSIFNASGVSDLLALRVTSESNEPTTIEVDSASSGFTGTVLGDTVTVDVRWLIQQWTSKNKSYPNYGFLLQSSGEYATLARSAFYSSGADSINAPKLVIIYTLPPSGFDY